MEQTEKNILHTDLNIADSLARITQYIELENYSLKKELNNKNAKIKILKDELNNQQNLLEGNRQLTNKLIGDLRKLQTDIDWYKRTYEHRSFFGMIREKIFHKKKVL